MTRVVQMAFAALLAFLAVGVGGSLLRRESEEIMLPTRDGTRLHTIIHFPLGKKERFPTVIDRSPYGYGDMEWVTDLFLPFGFVALGQDIRGTEQSEGNFTLYELDAFDSRDLGDWIVAQEWSDGRVFTIGASADGLASFQVPMTNPPWLAGQYMIWAPADMYNVILTQGAYKQKTAEDWLLGLTMPNPEVVYDNIDFVRKNEMRTGVWDKIALDARKYGFVNYPNSFWAGYWDLFLKETLAAFDGYNTQSTEAWRGQSKITIDPCGHCLEAAEFYTENAIQGRTGLVIAQMFEVMGITPRHSRPAIKNVTFYVMSSNDDAGKKAGQYWTTLDSFPVPVMTDFFLNADKKMSTKALPTQDSFSYKADPSDPIPTSGGANLPDSIGGSIPCGPLDQSEVDKRDDMVLFNTDVLSDELALSGPMLAKLFVSSDMIDTDFMVRISDVYPTGEVRLIQDNAVRMRWRENTITPVPMEKGQIYEITVNLWNTSYVVAPGHALRVAVQSSNFPRFSVNGNNGVLLADPLYPGTLQVATNTLFVGGDKYPSRVLLPVVDKRRQMPEIHILKEVSSVYSGFEHFEEELLMKAADRFVAGLIKRIKGM